jgi:hypothetical protein
MKLVRYLISTIPLLAVGGPTLGHHSFSAQFDIDKPVQLEGVVTEMRFSNPHAWLYIDVEQADGTIVNWALETGAAGNILARRGWRPSDLPPGTRVRVDGWHARNGTPTANISSVTLEDGTRWFAGNNTNATSAPQ